jgi:hypothetical protein
MEWSHSNFADLVLKGAYSSLKFSQVDEDLATKWEQMVEKTKLLLEKVQKLYEKQVNAKRRKLEYKVG